MNTHAFPGLVGGGRRKPQAGLARRKAAPSTEAGNE